MPQMVSVTPQAAPAPLNVIGESVTVLVHGEQTGSYEVFIQCGPEGVGPPAHSHPWDEAYYVLEGTLEVATQTQVLELLQGGFVHVPAGCIHRYAAKGGPAKFLSITSRPGAARFFGAMNEQVNSMPPDIPTVLAVAAQNQVTIAPRPAP